MSFHPCACHPPRDPHRPHAQATHPAPPSHTTPRPPSSTVCYAAPSSLSLQFFQPHTIPMLTAFSSHMNADLQDLVTLTIFNTKSLPRMEPDRGPHHSCTPVPTPK